MTEEVQKTELKLEDLTMLANIVDLAVTRGAFKGAEAETVGRTFNRLVAIIKTLAPPAEDAAEGEEGEE
ncbi:hypothetical protein N8072_01160 [bacterium]|jgi:hypothetical protein|nr:hypothetical protein [bacterium]MDC1257270.1 hypothetical protein [bacterium]